MNKFLFKVLNLHLHSEGSAEVGGTSTGTPANGSPAPSTAETVVVYGKTDDTTAEAPSTAPAVPPVDRNTKYTEFKSEYKDLYEQEFKSNLDRRLKTHTAEVGSLKGIVDPMLAYFGMKDLTALKAFIDSDIIPSIEGGYKAPAQDQALANSDGDTQAVSEAMPSAADMVEQGNALAEKLKAHEVAFDLKTEMDNPTVSGMLKKGYSLEQAYTLAHHDEILLRETQKVASATKSQTIEAIRSKGLSQVTEHASKPAPAVVHKADPSKFTKADLDEIERRVLRGEEIRF